MLEKIPGNLTLDLFCEISFIFHQILQLTCDRRKECFLRYYLLLITNLLRLNTVFLPPFFLSLSFLLSRKGCNYWAPCRHLTQNQFQKFNARSLYIQLWKLQNTEYKTLYTIFKINLEKQPPKLFCAKKCFCRFCKFNRKTAVLESPWRSPWSLF